MVHIYAFGAKCAALLDASMQKAYRRCVEKLASTPRKRKAALIRCLALERRREPKGHLKEGKG